MRFYEIDGALQDAIFAGDKAVRLKIDIDSGKGFFYEVFDKDIIEADFFGLKEAAGGTSARGEISVNSEQLIENRGRENLLGGRCGFSFRLGRGCSIFIGLDFTLMIRGFRIAGGRGVGGW
jgi:hypothetical protein